MKIKLPVEAVIRNTNDGIKNIRDKMDNLEWLQDVKFELKELMTYFNI